MKKKVKMTCVLKSGVIVKDAFRMAPDEIQMLNELKKYLESSDQANMTKLTFGYTTITVSEIAAISFKG
jgi:hypothetical protein